MRPVCGGGFGRHRSATRKQRRRREALRDREPLARVQDAPCTTPRIRVVTEQPAALLEQRGSRMREGTLDLRGLEQHREGQWLRCELGQAALFDLADERAGVELHRRCSGEDVCAPEWGELQSQRGVRFIGPQIREAVGEALCPFRAAAGDPKAEARPVS